MGGFSIIQYNKKGVLGSFKSVILLGCSYKFSKKKRNLLKMGEEVIKRFEEQLKCSICLNTYEEPKLLQCFHVYCKDCLVKVVVRNEQGALSISCPICRLVTPVLPGGVFELQSAFLVNEFLEILTDLKKSKDIENLEKIDFASLTKKKKKKQVALHCSKHEERELEYFCDTCEELVCSHCVYKKQEHHEHDSYPISSSFDKYVEEISMFLCPMENQLTRINGAVEQVDICFRAVSNQRIELEANIHDSIQELRNALDAREDELLRELNQITDDKLKDLQNQKSSLETTVAQLNSCLGFVRESLQTSSKGEVLKMKTAIVNQAIELSTMLQPTALKPCTDANVTLAMPCDASSMCRNYGSVHALADPLRCHVSGDGLEEAKVGKLSTVFLETAGIKSESDHNQFAMSVDCKLISEITRDEVKGKLERVGGNRYKVSYHPTIKGKHQLQIKLQNELISGSSFPIMVKAANVSSKVALTPVVVHSGLKKPYGLAMTRENNVIVSEQDNHCVSILTPSGKLVRTFGTRGCGNGCFEFPCGVAVDAKNNILVIDSINQRIQKFTSDGIFVASVGTKGGGDLQFKYPTDIAFNTSNDRFYVVDDNHRVQVLDSDLKFLDTFGRYGNGNGQFNTPWSIACDTSGRVYVADVNTQRIQVFASDGRFLRKFNRRKSRGEVALAIDSNNYVYISESDGHQVSVFSSEGLLVSSFGSKGKELGELTFPLGLAVDTSGVVYVCDSGNERIQMYI